MDAANLFETPTTYRLLRLEFGVGMLVSGGLMLVENLGVALAVAGGFTQLFLEFMEETRAADEPEEPGEESA